MSLTIKRMKVTTVCSLTLPTLLIRKANAFQKAVDAKSVETHWEIGA